MAMLSFHKIIYRKNYDIYICLFVVKVPLHDSQTTQYIHCNPRDNSQVPAATVHLIKYRLNKCTRIKVSTLIKFEV